MNHADWKKSYVFLKLIFKPFDLAVVKSGSFPRDVDVLDRLIPRVTCMKQLQFGQRIRSEYCRYVYSN